MKFFEVEIIYNGLESIPQSLDLDFKLKLLRNRLILEAETNLIKVLRKCCNESELKTYLNRDFSGNIEFINIEEVPDNINEFEQKFIDSVFLLTN